MQHKCCDIKKKPDKPLNIVLLKNSQDRCLNSLIWWKKQMSEALWANTHKCIALPSRNLRLENQQRSLPHSSVLHRTVCCSRDKWSLGITCVLTCGVDSNTIQLFYEEQAIIFFERKFYTAELTENFGRQIKFSQSAKAHTRHAIPKFRRRAHSETIYAVMS